MRADFARFFNKQLDEIVRIICQDGANLLRRVWTNAVFQNTSSLYLIQFAQYILPLITVPYLLRVLGPAIYGRIAFGQSLISYLMIITDYGFNFSATRQISVERSEQATLSQIVMGVWGAKAMLCLISFLLLVAFFILIPKFREITPLLVILFATVLGNVLFPIWLYQGMEKMFFISIINLIVQIFATIGIFVLVHNPTDYLIYVELLSGGALVAGIAGAIVAIRKFQIEITIPHWQEIKIALKDGWVLFLSTISISLYTTGNPLILGFLTNDTIVGYYVAAERIIKLVVQLLEPFSQAAYPRMSKLAADSKDIALYWAKRALFLLSTLGFGLSILLFLGSPLIVRILLGNAYSPSISVMRILSPLPLLIGIGSSFGRFIMLPFRFDNARFIVFLLAGGLNILLGILLAPYIFSTGMAIAVLLSEILVVALFYLFLRSKGLNPI